MYTVPIIEVECDTEYKYYLNHGYPKESVIVFLKALSDNVFNLRDLNNYTYNDGNNKGFLDKIYAQSFTYICSIRKEVKDTDEAIAYYNMCKSRVLRAPLDGLDTFKLTADYNIVEEVDITTYVVNMTLHNRVYEYVLQSELNILANKWVKEHLVAPEQMQENEYYLIAKEVLVQYTANQLELVVVDMGRCCITPDKVEKISNGLIPILKRIEVKQNYGGRVIQ